MGLVLTVAALALLAGFTAAGVSVTNLRVSARLSNLAVARNLAESAVQEGLARLHADLGSEKPVLIDGVGMGLPEGSRGFLTFDKASGEPFSTNNFLGEHPDGWERVVPDQTAHLVGVGESGGVRRQVEVVVHLPEFPVSMACDGPVTVTNSFIGAFRPEDDRPWVPGSGYSVEDDEIEPGHLVTNSESNNACVLDKATTITGDLQSRGQVHLNGAKVQGEVRAPWGQRAPVPDFDLAKFDPKSNPNIHYEELPQVLTGLTLVGNARRQGTLTLSGDLRLDNAFLFVDGDLTVNGAFRGVGAVVVTGECHFNGAVEVTSNEQIAVLSGRGMDVDGDGAERSLFKGLLYTKGPFEANGITIVGGFIVDDEAPTVIADSSVLFNGTTISPAMRREVFAVVPRFQVPPAGMISEMLFEDPDLGFPTGNWPNGTPPRDVDNVLDTEDPDWYRSAWRSDDPGVISVSWVDDKPVYRYQFYGLKVPASVDVDERTSRADLTGPKHGPPYELHSEGALIDRIVTQNCNPANAQYLDGRGSVPDPVQYRAYITQVVDHLSKASKGEEVGNFTIDPNEFIADGADLRILYRREF